MNTAVRYWMILCVGFIAQAAQGQTSKPADPAGRCHAIIVVGTPATPIYARRFADWAGRFRSYLEKKPADAPRANVVVLGGKTDKPATVESITREIAAMAKAVAPSDQFVLVLIGHGSRADANPTMVLAGPDLDAMTLAGSLATVGADNQVILNMTGSSGDFIASLAARGRVNISATAAAEAAEPVFAEWFLRGLESGRADSEGGAAKDGVVTLLEAYNWAAHQTALWICRQVAAEKGTWRVDGRESVEIFKKLFDGPDGPIATGGQREDGSRKLSADSDATRADEVVPLVVPPDIKPDNAGHWTGRRVINEHAQLEDGGQGGTSTDGSAATPGVCALRGPSGYEPVTPRKPGDAGWLAGRIVLGKPQLLTGDKK